MCFGAEDIGVDVHDRHHLSIADDISNRRQRIRWIEGEVGPQRVDMGNRVERDATLMLSRVYRSRTGRTETADRSQAHRSSTNWILHPVPARLDTRKS